MGTSANTTHNGFISCSFRVMLAFFLFVLCVGCASKEEKESKHLERARKYVEKSEFKKAVIEFRNVVQLNPENDAVHYELGETYLKLQQGREAYQSFSRAVSLNPENMKAQLKMGQILLLGKKTEEAKKRAELVLENSPDSIEALAVLSGVQVYENDLDSAVKTLEKALSINPSHFETHLSLARLFFLNGDLERAEKKYLKALSLDPKSRIPYIELSRLYGSKGQWDKAEAELKKMIRSSGSEYQNLSILARFYESREEWELAEKTYLQAADFSTMEDTGPLVNLGAYYARRKSYDQALEALRRASEIKQDDLNILVSIAQLQFEFKKLKEAEDTIDKVLEKDNGHLSANFLKGRLYLLKKDFSNALSRFDLIVKESPRNAMAHYFKALSLVGKGESRLAEQDLLKAVELNPRLLDAKLLLAEFYLRQRNQDLAREQIESSLKLAPKNTRALMLQGNQKLLEGDIRGAGIVFKEITKLDPDFAPAYVRLGLVYNLTKRPEAGLENLQKALELDPQQTDALTLIVGTYVREQKYDKAFQICKKQKEKAGGKTSHLALIQYLEGTISLARRDPKKAQHHFEMAIKTDPNIIAAYVALGKIHIMEKNIDQAISQYEAILKKNPEYLAAYMALGTIYDQQNDNEKAEAYYRKALEIKSDFAPAANNLAWNLAEKGGNIDEALGFAQTAKEQIPDNAAVMDTLGWIYYLKGSYLNAIAEFQDSLSQNPDNPVINLHLGLAYYKNKQPHKAKEFLDKALNMNQNVKGAEEARSILKEIETSASAG